MECYAANPPAGKKTKRDNQDSRLPAESLQEPDREQLGQLLCHEKTGIDRVPLKKLPPNFAEKKRLLKPTLVQGLINFGRSSEAKTYEEDYYDSDDDEALDGMGKPNMCNRLVDQYEEMAPAIYRKFVAKLPTFVFFEFGFHTIARPSVKNDEKWCWCPCSNKASLLTWQGEFTPGLDQCPTRYRMTENGFIEHLRSFQNTCFYHKLMLVYIDRLYDNYHGNSMHHKALYAYKSKDYNKALESFNQMP